MRIAMMGSGGIGGYFGGRMAAAGADVTFIARGRHLAAIRENGLRIESRDRGDAIINPANATDDPASVDPVDYVIIGVKLWDTEAVGKSILPMLGPDTAILSLQNGVDCDDILAPIVGRERLISGVAFIASSISEPGTIRHIGTLQRIVMGQPDNRKSARLTDLQDMMTKAGIAAEISDDIQRTLWEKFVFLVGLSSTTTLMRTTLGPIRDDRESREFLFNVMQETVAVGREWGVDLPADFAETRLPFADGLPADMTSSMYHDFEAGNSLELPWLAGTVVRLGREAGIETPVCQAVYAALLPKADGGTPP
tara:strand:- start:3935 stop:4864 length:930 start_codon:yes stop_codon:yes gene_type:complete